jgi:hypothetical protein
MAIDRIPGVGPTNADIATAVAAPSSATIATAVAAAVPTIGAINTSVANNAPSPNAWTVISSVTPSGTSTVFSSLSGYKKYRIIYANANSSESTLKIRLNGDTGNNYAHSYFRGITSNNYVNTTVNTTTEISLNGGDSNGRWGMIEFENPSLSLYKLVTFRCGGRAGQNTYLEGIGIWRNTAAITSISLVEDTSYSSGNITLLGAN